jgi:hypothetical protein
MGSFSLHNYPSIFTMAHLGEQDKDTVNMAALDAQSQHIKTSEESLVDEVNADAIGMPVLE